MYPQVREGREKQREGEKAWSNLRGVVVYATRSTHELKHNDGSYMSLVRTDTGGLKIQKVSKRMFNIKQTMIKKFANFTVIGFFQKFLR